MFRMFAGAAGAAVLMLAPAVASAQQADDKIAKGMSCVYERVGIEDSISIAENYLLGDLSGVDEKALFAALDMLEQACADELSLSSEQASLSREMAIYGVTADYLGEDLLDLGVDEDAISGVFDYYQSLGEVDLEKLYDANWRDDAEFAAKLKQGFLAAGLPDQKAAIDTALDIIEIAALSDDAAFTYMMTELDVLDEVEQ